MWERIWIAGWKPHCKATTQPASLVQSRRQGTRACLKTTLLSAVSVVSVTSCPRGLWPARLPCPWDFPGDLPNPGVKPASPALAGGFLNHWVTSKAEPPTEILVQVKCLGWGKKKAFATSAPRSCNCLSSPVPSVKGNGWGLVGPNQKQLVWWMGASLSPYFSRMAGFPDSQSCFKQGWPRTSPGGPVVKTSLSNAGGAGLIHGWEAKIPHASWSKKPKYKTEAILQQIQ